MSAADWSTLDLAAGERVLIEASAGTGKTWTISALYLRLILERSLSVNQVAVTTFTEAAAQELRERLRNRLLGAEQLAAAARVGAVDAAEAWLLQRWQENDCRHADHLRLRLALAELDQAPIGTLHALCRKVLSDQPFAAGGGFRLGELLPEQAIQQELLRDLLRYLAHVPADGLRASALASLAGKSDKVLASLIRFICDDSTEIRLADAGDAERVLALFSVENADALIDFVNRLRWKRINAALRTRLLAFAEFLRAGDLLAGVDLDADLLAPEALVGQLHPEGLALWDKDPASEWVITARSLLAEREHVLLAVALAEIAPLLRAWRSERLNERNQFTFDDLINRVLDALRAGGDGESALAQVLHQAWPVALIDEFQDTDSRQYAIFDRIFSDAAGQSRGLLVMIGDPKQAIYAFRGGDIHAYLRAAAGATQRLSLATNHRSSRALVAALNGFYALAGDGFGAAGIGYQSVAASSGCDDKPLRINGVEVMQPLLMHGVQFEVLPVNKEQRQDAALDQCADEIVALLQPGHAHIGSEPVVPGDIAVLLPNNRQVMALRERLQRRRVPCVGSGRSAVFASPWAEALRLVLYAVANPGDAPALRAALASELFGLDFPALHALLEDAPAWAEWLDQFHRLDQQWRQQGVLAVINTLVAGAAPQLLARAEGERALTDLRHLGELLQQQAQQLAGREQVLAWLSRQCSEDGDDDASDEQQVRIESDHKRVQLMTLHASKGLEFPVVFLPLMSLHEGRKIEFPVVSDAGSARRIVDLGSAERAQAQRMAAEEDQRERLRILYVALTRAKYLCHVLVMPFDRSCDGRQPAPKGDPERSALDRLLQQIKLRSADPGVAPVPEAAAIEWRHGWLPQPGALRLQRAPAAARHVLEMPSRRPYRGSYSFSTLTRGKSHTLAEDDAATVDETLPMVASAIEPLAEMRMLVASAGVSELSALSFVRGPDFGNALHAIFEHRQHALPVVEQSLLIRKALRDASVRVEPHRLEGLVRALGERIDGCLRADIGAGLRLGDIPMHAQRAEMSFHFELSGIRLETLRALCTAHAFPELIPESLGERTLRGFMTGKIDLVFSVAGRCHVLDYKSNHLGDALEAYQGEALESAMREHHYPFQALLYMLAVDRYLHQRQADYRREQHLGDAIYLFARAAGMAPGAGIWRRAFPTALIAALDAAFSISPSEVSA